MNISSLRKTGILAAVILALLGVFTLFAPAAAGLSAAYLITGGFTVYGLFKIFSYFRLPKPFRNGFVLADGLLSALLGGMILLDAIRSPMGKAEMIATLAFAAGFCALFNGISQIADYFTLRKMELPGIGFFLAGGILRVILAILLFIVFSILLGMVTHALGKIFRLPLLRQIDGLLGGIAGLLQGVVCCVLVCLLLQLVVSSNPDHSAQWVHEGTSQSIVYQTVTGFLPAES